MLNALPTIEIDAMLILGAILLTLNAITSLLGGNKLKNSTRLDFSRRKDANTLMNIGSALTLAASIPLTIYITTRAFPGIYQQLIVSLITIGIIAGVDQIRKTIQFGTMMVFAIVYDIITIPLGLIIKALTVAYNATLGTKDNPDDPIEDETDDTA